MIRSLLLLSPFFLWSSGVVLAAADESGRDEGYRVAPTPAWVEAHALPALPETVAAGYVAEVLLQDTQVKLEPEPVTYLRHVSRALTAAGVASVSARSLTFNPAFQHLELHKLVIWRDGKPRDVTASVRTRLLQREEALDSGIENGVVTVLLSPDDVQVGDLVDLAYSLRGQNPIFKKASGMLPLSAGVPIHELRLRLLSGTEPLQLRANSGSVPVTQAKTKGGTEYRVLLRDVQAVHDEEGSPSWDDGSRWLQYSEYRNWQEVARWGAGLYPMPVGKTPAFDALHARLAAAATSPEDFVSRALQYTQEEIRYLALGFGQNAQLPHSPEAVITHKFGDCKDKALLLTALLRRHGIPAAPALVATEFRDGLASVLAAPDVFDHAITRVELAGKTYWLDGTRQAQGGRLETLGRDDFTYALVLDEASTGLTRMYPEPSQPLVAEVEEHYYVDDFQRPMRLEVKTSRYRNVAESMRYGMGSTPMHILQQMQLDNYRRYYEGIRSTALPRIQDDRVNNVLTTYEAYEIPAFWQQDAGRLKGSLAVIAFDGMVELPASSERRTPLLLSMPRQARSRIYVHFPADVGIRPEPADVKVESGAFSYHDQRRYAGGIYSLEGNFTIRQAVVPVAEFPGFLAAGRGLKNAMSILLSLADPDKAGKKLKPAKAKTKPGK